LNPRHFGSITFISVSFGESRLLVSWYRGGRCGMACSDEDRGRSTRPGVEDWGWLHRSGTRWPGDREVRWCFVRSAPHTWRREAQVSWLSLKTKVHGLLVVWSQNRWNSFLRFGLKTGGYHFSRFGLRTGGSGFPVWASKPVIPHSKKEETKPPYLCPGYSNHMYSNNMINRCHVQ
jgi:hypothetical protein